MSEVTPAEATEAFMAGISGGDKQVTAGYADNSYVNFLTNVKGDSEDVKRLREAVFSGMDYEVLDTLESDGLAVAKVRVTNNDFSKVMDSYEKESYDFVMDNLYDEKIEDKDYLNEKCTEIYIEQLEKAAGTGASGDKADTGASGDKAGTEAVEKILYIPMEDDGFYGWRIILSDKIMKAMTGNRELPTETDDK